MTNVTVEKGRIVMRFETVDAVQWCVWMLREHCEGRVRWLRCDHDCFAVGYCFLASQEGTE